MAMVEAVEAVKAVEAVELVSGTAAVETVEVVADERGVSLSGSLLRCVQPGGGCVAHAVPRVPSPYSDDQIRCDVVGFHELHTRTRLSPASASKYCI